MAVSDGLIIDIHGDMMRLNWDWEHPTIQNFLHKARMGYREQCPSIPFDTRSMETVPPKVLTRLAELINIYYQCQQTLDILKIDWSDAAVRVIFAQWGKPNSMPLGGWKQLLAMLDKRWFEAGGGF